MSRFLRVAGRVLLYLCLACLIAVVVFPLYWMINISVQREGLDKYPPPLFPRDVYLSNYGEVLFPNRLSVTRGTFLIDKPFVVWLRNSLIVALSSTLICILFSLFGGYAISRYQFRGKNLFAFFILATQMLPAPLLLIPIYVIFRKFGLLDNLFGLVVVDVAFGIPLCVWMLRSFFDTLPDEIEDAAIVDGCTRMGAFFRIHLRLIAPGIVATSIFAFLIAWDEFFAANTLINTEGRLVASVGLSTLIGERIINWGDIMAAATVFTVPPIVFFLVVQKYLVSGLTAGSVKG